VPGILAITNKVLLLAILVCIFLAFQVPIAPGTVVAGVGISQLFMLISPTPAGLGVVEGTMTLLLSGMYISLEDAIVLTMAFRGITFWLPILFGLIAFQVIIQPKNSLPRVIASKRFSPTGGGNMGVSSEASPHLKPPNPCFRGLRLPKIGRCNRPDSRPVIKDSSSELR
jgi:hypothetical protein